MKVEAFYICHKYKIWVIYLRSFLLNIQELNLSSLGQQYDIERLLNIFLENNPNYNNDLLSKKNKLFFLAAKNIINFKTNYEIENAQQELTKLTVLADEIEELILIEQKN